MKKLLALVLSCIFVLLLASCGEELPASDYVKKGKIMVDNTIPFVIDEIVAIDAKEAECALLVGAHYSSFAAKFGYKVFHYAATPGISSLCKYYTVYPLNDGRLLYVIVDKNDKGDYIIQSESVIADENTNINHIFAWDAPYVLMNIPMEIRESEYKNGIEKSSLVYKTYMKLENSLNLPICSTDTAPLYEDTECRMTARMIKWENDSAKVYELFIYPEKEVVTFTSTTYTNVNGEYNKTDFTEVVVELQTAMSFLKKLEDLHYSAYYDIKDLTTIDKGVFLRIGGNFTYEDEWHYYFDRLLFSYNTTDGLLAELFEALADLAEGKV
ncbi:MAG: hypothetical protein J6L23_05540 [Clostridia bacterium]|nr:hypothetical protein [Clostridia bacterium]